MGVNEGAVRARYAFLVAKKKATSKKPGDGALVGGPGPRIAVYYGSDAFQSAERVRALRESLQSELGADGVEVFRYDGEQAAVADVLDECRSFDLMSRHKVVVVDNADSFVAGDNRPLIERYAASPVSNATLVLRSTRWNKGKLDKLIEAAGGEVRKCEPETLPKAAGWAVKRAEKRHGATLTREAAVALVDLVGADLGRIDAELGKLSVAAAEGEPITPDLVRDMVGQTREEEVWKMQRRLCSADAAESLRAVHEALWVSRIPAQLVWYAQADMARKLHAMAFLMERGAPEGVAAGRAKVWDRSALGEIVSMARGAGSGRLAALFERAIGCDARVKRGYGDQERACEMLAVAFGAVIGRE